MFTNSEGCKVIRASVFPLFILEYFLDQIRANKFNTGVWTKKQLRYFLLGELWQLKPAVYYSTMILLKSKRSKEKL